MCGIVGYCRLSPNADLTVDLQHMNDLIAHRGPDEEGYYSDPSVGLAMRRLSIIDLVSGNQPMSNETGTLQVVYNGEIYNYRELRDQLTRQGHRFTTQSDTEVLVHGYEEWGEDLPRRLRGMFAFAIWDTEKQLLFLSRDHFGIKPLYYAQIDGILLFSSEIKSILSHPGLSRRLDPKALNQYLSFLYVPEPHTIFQGIQALPPAHSLICRAGQVVTRRYWEFQPEFSRYKSPQEAIESIRAAFEDSVRAMLVADVPVGLFLSGGIDSVSILAMMARHMDEPVRTFSIGFGEREKHWDELDAARSIANFYTTQHREFRLDPDVVNLLPRVVQHFDQPFANPTSVILYLLSGETRRYVKVALSGTGGDEMFAGYPRYLGMIYYQRYRHLPTFLRKGAARLARRVARDATNGRLGPQRARRLLEGGALPFDDCYLRLLTVLDETRKQSLYSPDFRRTFHEADTFSFIRPYLALNGDGSSLGEIERLMAADMQTYLPYNQLAYGDRMSMAQSLEVRVPFVDQRLIEVAGSIPLRWKVPGGTTKGLFRAAMAPYLPQDVLNAPKRGLNLPIALWFRHDLRSWVRDLLSPERITQRGYFQPHAIDSLLKEHEAGFRDHSLLIWALVVLETWHQLYIDQETPLLTASMSSGMVEAG
jgi:asparagine synthase (glutamine-hydrolysing)